MQLTWRKAEGALVSAVLATPVGQLSLSVRGEALVSIDFVDDDPVDFSAGAAALPPLLVQAGTALLDYFRTGAFLNLPLDPVGTDFQRRVWQRLADIPQGTVISYGQLAREMGSGARAVAGACRANPYPLVIPCHRVVAAHGLGGYCGATDGGWLDIKRRLLAHEQVDHENRGDLAPPAQEPAVATAPSPLGKVAAKRYRSGFLRRLG